MNRGDNPRRQGRFADAAPHQRPNQHPNRQRPAAGRPPCRDCGYLQSCLNIAHRQIAEWNNWSQTVEPMLGNWLLCDQRLQASNATIRRLEEHLESKERELTEMSSLLQKSREDISERDTLISSLRESVQSKTMQADTIERFWKEECDKSYKPY
eukprot:superscaffoldBa00001383_g10317